MTVPCLICSSIALHVLQSEQISDKLCENHLAPSMAEEIPKNQKIATQISVGFYCYEFVARFTVYRTALHQILSRCIFQCKQVSVK